MLYYYSETCFKLWIVYFSVGLIPGDVFGYMLSNNMILYVNFLLFVN